MPNSVIAYIHSHGTAEKPIKGSDLAEHFGISGIKVRKAVNAARCSGVPICSSSNGYYYSEDKEQIRKTVDSMLGRIEAQQNAIFGLQSLLNQ